MANNADISKALRELGFLTEVEGGDNVQFKSRAYYRAADTIANLKENISDLYSQGGAKLLLQIPSIGRAIASKVEQFIKEGRIDQLEELRKKIPINSGELQGIEGLGPKTIKVLYDKLQIRDLAELERSAADGRLRTVPGFTERKEKDILKRIEFFRRGKGRRLIGEVYPLVKQIESRLLQVDGVRQAVAAGSVRRMRETIGDIDYLVLSDKPEAVLDFFVKMPEVDEIIARGPAKAFVKLADGIDADLLVVPHGSWGSALQYFTGSKEHSVELRRIAIAKGLRLNEWGVFEGERKVAGETEEQVYNILGLQWIPPEMREDRGELDIARKGKIPKIIEYGSLKGDLQVHTERSDGTASMEQMAVAARGFGLDYISVTDHTKSLAFAGGLDENELLDQASKASELSDRLGMRVLSSAEVNILKDGTLDIANNVLDKLDIAGAAIHSHFSLPIEAQTERLVKAARNPSIDILFHPTGRLINKREGYPVNIEKVIDVALDTGTALEIDAHYDRLDLKDDYVRMAVQKGVKLTIDSDAHHPVHFAYLVFGIAQARRGWATANDVLNTLPADKLLDALK
ncbi:MAG TPA: DNA polymerase/3'-5' exonuclease PolX [Nitrososphaera sp.]|nr:DNA polymerase/3'-5' exonuclease PolX [Nitrososphaera sp.]